MYYSQKGFLAFLAVAVCLGAWSCQSADAVNPDSIPGKISLAHGYEDFQEIDSIAYTFYVQRPTATLQRRWIWNPNTQTVTRILDGKDTLRFRYQWPADSTNEEAMHQFINDKYWLLFPFQLTWDTGYEYVIHGDSIEPLSGENLQAITVRYNPKDGFTPGDAYDVYFDENYMLRTWSFKKGNASNPSLSTTWSDYKTFRNLKIATTHYGPDSTFLIALKDIQIAWKKH